MAQRVGPERHSSILVPAMRSALGELSAAAAYLRRDFALHWDAMIARIQATTSHVAGRWSLLNGVPYLAAEDQEEILAEARELGEPSPIDLWAGTVIARWEVVQQDLQRLVERDQRMQANRPSALIAAPPPAPPVHPSPPAPPSVHGRLPLSDRSNTAGCRGVPSDVDARVQQRRYETSVATLRNTPQLPVSEAPGEVRAAIMNMHILAKQDVERFALVVVDGHVKLGEALDLLIDPNHQVASNNYLTPHIAPEMLKVSDLLHSLLSPTGMRLHDGPVGPQLDRLKQQLLPLMAIAISFECQRILDFLPNSVKEVHLNVAQGWIGAPITQGGPNKKRGR